MNISIVEAFNDVEKRFLKIEVKKFEELEQKE